MNDILLETRHLTHRFLDGTIGIKDINLKIYSGDFVVIAGTNGSGKTVLTRHFNGLLKPTEGDVLFEGVSVAKNLIETRKNIGLIFQDSESQFVGQTVEEEVAFGPENLNLPPFEIAKIVQQSLAVVGLNPLSKRNPHTLSGGQKRKLAVAGVLAMKPKIIVFDEPFTGLDYPGIIQILTQMVELHQAGHTIILITHELEKVLAHANRLVVIHEGELVAAGTPETVVWDLEDYGVRMPLNGGERIETLTWLK